MLFVFRILTVTAVIEKILSIVLVRKQTFSYFPTRQSKRTVMIISCFDRSEQSSRLFLATFNRK
jgi:hypothetical protein